MSKLTQGFVTITLAGEEKTLKPSLAAMQALSRIHGGLGGLTQALVAQNVDAVLSTLRYGLKLNDAQMKPLAQQVYETGLGAELIVPLIEYVGILGNGGKPRETDGEDEPAGSAEGN